VARIDGFVVREVSPSSSASAKSSGEKGAVVGIDDGVPGRIEGGDILQSVEFPGRTVFSVRLPP
jgi:hypothetical protein